MRNSTRLSIEIAAIVLVGIAAFFAGKMFFRSAGPAAPADIGSTAAAPGNPIPPAVVTAREDVPAGITVPEPDSAVAANIAKPVRVSTAGVNTTFKKRVFTASIEQDKLFPDTFIVREGDIVDISLTAVDKAYGFSQPDYGWGVSLAKGETKNVESQFTQTGKFSFYCQSCGGPAAGPRGYIIVVSKNAP